MSNDPQRPIADGMLEILVGVVNATDSRMSMTLSVSGGVITGLMVGHGEWLRLVNERIARDSPDASGMLDAWVEEADQSRWGEEMKGEEGTFIAPNFVHLAGASYVEWAGLMPDADSDGLLWRGRLSEVSGWSLGSFGGA